MRQLLLLVVLLAAPALADYFESKCARVWTFRSNTAEVSQLLGLKTSAPVSWLEVYVQHEQCAAPLDALQFIELRIRYRTPAGQVRERRQTLSVDRSTGPPRSAVFIEFDPAAVLLGVTVEQKFPEDFELGEAPK